ncbi:dTDP-glucose 4,6-dehydratase [Helicobacter enhydrae]|uniref:dTDP-glucose 4,6-dehydratase n=1 Tax=Helicobacter enhydrae TaxID=222136 RepID=A0A1B1U5J4_9HELI|nr:dTDP-glucose 4,6-dehydratase [Helicobacter enhydrae]ANV98029.1 dTDP-glucose 4,6-dehydratase [Helicobacter enhydrae]
MRNILITGGAGFIGSNFIDYFLKRYPHYKIFNLDVLTYAGKLENMNEFYHHPNHTFIQGDICDLNLLGEIFEKYKIDSIIHFAAESHVDNSIASPNAFVQTNINGTFSLLQTALHFWLKNPFDYKTPYGIFHHISTDEVYGSLGDTGYFTETTPYAPNSPYSASKASSDMLVKSYHHTYGLKTFITNCSNNYGPKQHDEKLIPTIIRKAINQEDIPIYGNGLNIRDWLYVLDHCAGIDLVFHSQNFGETYNIGGNNEHTNIQIAHLVCKILDELHPKAKGKYSDQITYVKDRLGHDHRYAIDASKIRNQLNWTTHYPFVSGIHQTILWYLKSQG